MCSVWKTTHFCWVTVLWQTHKCLWITCSFFTYFRKCLIAAKCNTILDCGWIWSWTRFLTRLVTESMSKDYLFNGDPTLFPGLLAAPPYSWVLPDMKSFVPGPYLTWKGAHQFFHRDRHWAMSYEWYKYVCIYVYNVIYIYIYMYLYIARGRDSQYTYIYIYTCIYIYVCVCTYIYMYAMCIYIYTYLYIYIYSYMLCILSICVTCVYYICILSHTYTQRLFCIVLIVYCSGHSCAHVLSWICDDVYA